ncbi:MAG: radical SAM protein [Candidatus Omnitrophica bacterium]|nr:radical SAM protein [Candidatus Omnitrophota bacterium]
MSRAPDKPDPYDRIVARTLEKRIPFKLDWELTYRCNERCVHCYQTGPTHEEELTTQEAYAVLDELAEAGALYLTFTGGEILMRDDFFDIARYARRRGFALRLFTNGTLIDEPTADKIRDLSPLSVEISLYAANRDTHERITRVAGSFGKTRRAFELLRERQVATVIKCTVTKMNVAEIQPLRELARSLGCRASFSFTVIPRVDLSTDILKLRLEGSEIREVFERDDSFTRDIRYGGVPNYKPLCAAGFNSLYISPYAEVYPCVVLRESCGNFRTHTLSRMWDAPVFRKLRAVRFEDLTRCSACSEASYCDRCIGLAWMEKGSMYDISPHDCTLARVRREVVEDSGGRAPSPGDNGKDHHAKEEKKVPQAANSL